MKTIVVLVAVLLFCLNLPAVSQPLERGYSRHAAYLELGGQGIFYSLNYDYRFTKFFAGRVGFSRWTLDNFLVFADLTVSGFPIVGEFLMGGENHFFEIGLGVIPVWGESSIGPLNLSSKGGVIGTASIGYRYQPADGGFLFRATVPGLFTDKGGKVWGGVSFGYAF